MTIEQWASIIATMALLIGIASGGIGLLIFKQVAAAKESVGLAMTNLERTLETRIAQGDVARAAMVEKISSIEARLGRLEDKK